MSDLAADIARAVGDHFTVTATGQGWVEIRLDPAHAMRPETCDQLDFIRVDGSDGAITVLHMSHNGVGKGKARFDGTMVGSVYGFVREMTETIF